MSVAFSSTNPQGKATEYAVLRPHFHGTDEEIQSALDEKCFATQNNYNDRIIKTKIVHGFGSCDTRCINMVFTLKWLEILLTGQSAQIKYLPKKENKQDSPGIDAKTSLTYWFLFFSSKFEVCDKTLYLKNPLFFSNMEKKNQWRENKKCIASWLF